MNWSNPNTRIQQKVIRLFGDRREKMFTLNSFCDFLLFQSTLLTNRNSMDVNGRKDFRWSALCPQMYSSIVVSTLSTSPNHFRVFKYVEDWRGNRGNVKKVLRVGANYEIYQRTGRVKFKLSLCTSRRHKEEQRSSYSHSYPWHYIQVNGQLHAPASLPQGKVLLVLSVQGSARPQSRTCFCW